ncbi:MAG: hypothetical protein IIA67_05625 [Planctomycetes bacterium]|nr:hypothetical protein [Planctomycetota bacterium]
MARKLLTVEYPLFVEGRGVGILPVLVPQGEEVFHKGDPIDIKFPDGRITRTQIADLSIPTPNPNLGCIILLPRSFEKGDVPVGAELWSVDS